MRRFSLILLLIVLLLPLGGTMPIARAQESRPTKCVCSDGQTLYYDPELVQGMGYVMMITTWQMAGLDWCYYECLDKCGCDRYDPDLTCSYNCIIGPLPPARPGATVAPVPQMPCPEPAFFYPGIDLVGYFTEESPLRFSRADLVADVSQGLQRYVAEGNKISPGVKTSDAYYVAKSFISAAMPTGKEAALQQAARDLARTRRQADPNYRLTPGDLLYLSLQQNGGNVRDALLTCHAALYRDGGGGNKRFIEQEGLLTPLRSPAGYEDGPWSYTTPQGASRTINPRQELGGDEQGVWYHLFGMAALEYTDMYGCASYYAAWTAISWGGLPENYTDRVIARGVPSSGLGGGLADLAVALEDNVRANMGKAPDIVKHCINYNGIAVGTELKRVAAVEIQRQNNFVDPAQLVNYGDILEPTGVVIYKSPLSLHIEGRNGEWFTFDQETGAIDGNTAQIYFEAFLEEDGEWGVVAIPFFPVRSMQMEASGDGPVVLGLYDAASRSSSVYEFTVRQGDAIAATSFGRPPKHNGTALTATYEYAGRTFPVGGLLIGGGVLLAIALVGLVVWGVVRKSGKARQRPAVLPVAPPPPPPPPAMPPREPPAAPPPAMPPHETPAPPPAMPPHETPAMPPRETPAAPPPAMPPHEPPAAPPVIPPHETPAPPVIPPHETPAAPPPAMPPRETPAPPPAMPPHETPAPPVIPPRETPAPPVIPPHETPAIPPHEPPAAPPPPPPVIPPHETPAPAPPVIPPRETPAMPPRPRPAGASPANTCPRCWSANEGPARFCYRCGTPLAALPAAPRYCSGCGQPVSPADRFCRACGAQIS